MRRLHTECLFNQKQIALGIMMYVQDYDEIFPRKNASYKELIFPYIKNEGVFRCPLYANMITLKANPQCQPDNLNF